MGRPTRARGLTAWINGERVGTWSLPAGIGGSTLSGEAVESWFDNRLPDSDASRLMRTPAGVFSVQALLHENFPESIAEPVLTGLEAAARQLQHQLV
jgi:hypothetical protein